MSIADFSIAGLMSAAGGAMSAAGLAVPHGFEALHFVAAVAMACGYIVGRETAVYSRPQVILFATCSCICCVGYYIAINLLGAGLFQTILLAMLSFLTFFPFAALLAMARAR